MLTLNDRIYELNGYKRNFTEEEKEQLTQCFKKIQDYIITNYMSKDSREFVKLQLHYNSFTHSYLVLNFVNKQVYLSHRDHGSSIDNYFCNNESSLSYKPWKYTLAYIVIERWNEIKGILDNYFSNIKSTSELCKEFSL